MALEPVVPKQTGAASGVTTTPEAEVEMEVPDVEKETGTSEQLSEPEKDEKKIFQAFNIKPLRQKLLTPAERDALNSKTDEEPENKEEEPSAEEQTTTVQGPFQYWSTCG